ncbi:MAG: NAD(P)-binding domain-containing protein, partial [Gammaproteobacteria bacterium]|nr:NAD(P)-binding domain-containing protein [Gammaproteobacteria bacterium]
LSIDRNIPDNVIDLRAKKWNKKKYSAAEGLLGRKVGIVGLGEIGIAFAERARAFGMDIYAMAKPGRSGHIQERINRIGITFVTDVISLAETCDVISFHVPVNAKTKGMINQEFLSHMKPDAVIINTSRGEIVDDDALIRAMETKGIRVGLDVYNNEPTSGVGEFFTSLSTHPNVYGTHHIGASTEQAQNAIAETVVEVLQVFEKGNVMNCVNLSTKPLGSAVLTVRHFDRVGVLSAVLEVLKKASINVEQMENQVFDGAKAACATIHVSEEISPQVISAIGDLDDVIHLSVRNT